MHVPVHEYVRIQSTVLPIRSAGLSWADDLESCAGDRVNSGRALNVRLVEV
jgi:hypothetical protein